MTYNQAFWNKQVAIFQEGLKNNQILAFAGPAGFLSNFDRRRMMYMGQWYGSREHLFQSFKFEDPKLSEEIRLCRGPGDAKRRAKELQEFTRSDWKLQSIPAMQRTVYTFFSQWEDKRRLLLLTKDMHLEEGNTWGDTFWGTVDRKGENWLGSILMWTRDIFANDIKYPGGLRVLELAMDIPLIQRPPS